MATAFLAEPVRTPEGSISEFDKASVASLSHADIQGMDRTSLVEAIRATELPTLHAEAMAHVEFLEPGALRRILFLARECCRNQGY